MARRPIDFRRLREMISPAQVLRLMGWPRNATAGYAYHGPCPWPGCSSARSRVLTHNHQVAYCHRCKRTWDAVGLWALHRRTDSYAAALDLCDRLSLEAPYIAPAGRS